MNCSLTHSTVDSIKHTRYYYINYFVYLLYCCLFLINNAWRSLMSQHFFCLEKEIFHIVLGKFYILLLFFEMGKPWLIHII